PFYGKLKKLVVRQTTGTSLAFTAAIYSARAIETEEGSAATPYHKSLYQIIPSQTQTNAGSSFIFITDNDGYVYVNRSKGMGDPDRSIYVGISFSSPTTENTTWVVSLGLAVEGA
ncbi:MAG: hypothetical protein QXK26_02075, partial [Candidatus Bathyarchaeia archaeon]